MIPSIASTTEAKLADAGARVLARIPDSKEATDLALALTLDRLAVVRCVKCARAKDYAALATMLKAGDFAWAGLVFSEDARIEPLSQVETFHVGELSRLIGRLRTLQGETAS